MTPRQVIAEEVSSVVTKSVRFKIKFAQMRRVSGVRYWPDTLTIHWRQVADFNQSGWTLHSCVISGEGISETIHAASDLPDWATRILRQNHA